MMTRALLMSILITSGVLLMWMYGEACFQRKEPMAIGMMCAGALLNSAALLVLMGPAKVLNKRSMSREQAQEIAQRMGQIR